MFEYDDYGNITCHQGDSGVLPFQDLPTDKNYLLYFSIYNNKRQILGNELYVYVQNDGTAKFIIPPNLTDLLTVPSNKETEEYYYGVKLCFRPTDGSTDYEETLLIGGKDIGEANTITVYPKETEGLTTESNGD